MFLFLHKDTINFMENQALQGFATRLQETLTCLHLTTTEFAQRIGEIAENVSLWTSGQEYPDSKTLLKIIFHFPQINWFYVWEGNATLYGDIQKPMTVVLSSQNYDAWEQEHKLLEETQKQLKIIQKENHLLSELYQLIKTKYESSGLE
jgi:DNA-binding transcriptional regulator YiaG